MFTMLYTPAILFTYTNTDVGASLYTPSLFDLASEFTLRSGNKFDFVINRHK